MEIIEKLEGIVDAIEQESKVPSPSHQNLARLVGMFCRELVAVITTSEPLDAAQWEGPPATADGVNDAGVNTPDGQLPPGAAVEATITGDTPGQTDKPSDAQPQGEPAA